MSNPRFRPRDFTLEPDGFGRVETVEWDEARLPVQLRVSQIQHGFATQIRRLAKAQHGTVAAYARSIGQSEDRLAKMLRGEAIMRLEDVALAEIHLGWLGFAR